MRAAVIRKYGKPEVLQVEPMPEPVPREHEVKIKVMASSVNPVDWKVRSGSVAILSGWKFPKILGADFSGIVLECGAQVKDIKPGDEVFGLSNAMSKAGAYAEVLACDSNKMAAKPPKLTHAQAACIPLAGSTAYQALHRLGGIKPGMHILITGCTGGVGHYAVQIAKASGAHVTGVCHSRNAALAGRLGCDEVMAYDRVDFLRQNTRYDILFDAAAKYGYRKCRSVLKPGGIYVSTLPTPLLMLMHGLSGFLPGRKGKFVSVHANRKDLEKLSELCNAGKIMPLIEHTFPLANIAEAHALSETEKVRGKISIEIREV